MALEIKENRGLFEIIGKISAQNVNALKVYFQSILEMNDNIVISIEKVTAMDTSAALLFEKLYCDAAKNNKVIAIVGKQNHLIAEIMSLTNTDYILSSDRV